MTDEIDAPHRCTYCNLMIDCDDFLNCTKCQGNVHIKCLKRPGTPGDLLGDVFFAFICTDCAEESKEVFIRQRLPWLMVITLTIYNLSIQSKGLSHQGYFHWRTHIASFIDKNWNFLFDPGVKRKKKWTGTVSGMLSHNSPAFFTSGQEYFQDSGWWKLTYNQTPKFYWKLYEQLSLKKQQLRNERRNAEEANSSNQIISILADDHKRTRRAEDEESCSRTKPYMGREPKKSKTDPEPTTSTNVFHPQPINSVQTNLMDFLAENLTNEELLTDLPPIGSKSLLPLISPAEHESEPVTNLWESGSVDYDCRQVLHSIVEENESDHIQNIGGLSESSVDSEEFKPRIIQVTNYQECQDDQELGVSIMPSIKLESQSDSEHEEDQDDLICEKSLFVTKPKRDYPWLDEKEELDTRADKNEYCDGKNVHLMSEYEERDLHNKLKAILAAEKEYNLPVPAKIRRLHRKLCVRDLKRKTFLKIFNIDAFGSAVIKTNQNFNPQPLDRYYHIISGSTNKETSFYSRIIGTSQDEVFESPFTSRLLHPFIYRNTKCFPPWVKLMCELQYAVNEKVPSRSPIDFCYVRPYHIAAVNALLQQMFWPGIDMSECLSYPDFSVVALYKKLVVGCAFLVPDVGYNEAYISFMAVRPGWQRSGIANFMLYHLTQTCMGKDITLHVSATNPAICLYQKFGFKIEEVILDFYDKYLPADSTHSRHAFLLRMKR